MIIQNDINFDRKFYAKVEHKEAFFFLIIHIYYKRLFCTLFTLEYSNWGRDKQILNYYFIN